MDVGVTHHCNTCKASAGMFAEVLDFLKNA